MRGYSLTDFHSFIDAPVGPESDQEPSADDVDTKKHYNSKTPEAGAMLQCEMNSACDALPEGNVQHMQTLLNRDDGYSSQSSIYDLPQQTENDDVAYEETLSEVLLFKDGTGVRIMDTAENLGEIYAIKEILFRRVAGNGHKQQIQTLDAERNLTILSAASACSEFEKVAKIIILKNRKPTHAVFKECDAKRILGCDSFLDKLPPLRIVTKCPVIVETPDRDIKIITRYDRNTGIYAMGERPQDVQLEDAVDIILSSVDEFLFKSPADKSRALASIISPGMIMGGIVDSRSPIELLEADDSQAGKGFKAKISAAFYNEIPYTVNQQRGGVGSMEESLNQALIEGRLFINFDNLKPTKDGVFDSEKLCSLLTEDCYFARMLRRGMYIDPRLHFIQTTTNGCALSKDLMNRALPIAIMKRNGYSYKKYPEGSILDHIRHNQSKFLGAVFSIIRAWVREGKPGTTTTAHNSSFTPWTQSLDWIVQNIMEQAPLLDGYAGVRDRITKPYLQKLRAIALTIIKVNRGGQWLTASDIIETVGPEGCELPGIDSGYDFDTMSEYAKENVKRQLGLSFKRAFEHYGSGDALIHDGIRIMRKEEPKTYDGGTTNYLKYYTFSDE